MSMAQTALAAAAWLASVNLLAFFMYADDKRRALQNRTRISEASLLQVVWLGGGGGAWAAMRRFRHKTRKQCFRRRFAMILWAQALAAAGLLLWWIAAGGLASR